MFCSSRVCLIKDVQEEIGDVHKHNFSKKSTTHPLQKHPCSHISRRKDRKVAESGRGSINKEMQCLKLNLKEYVCFKHWLSTAETEPLIC